MRSAERVENARTHRKHPNPRTNQVPNIDQHAITNRCLCRSFDTVLMMTLRQSKYRILLAGFQFLVSDFEALR